MRPLHVRLRPFHAAGLIALAASCAPAAPQRLGTPRDLPSPAAPGSSSPRLVAAPAGGVLMTWFEPAPRGGHALRFARLDGAVWSEPATIASGDSFFVNWADFPALAALDRERLAVSYPWRSGEDPYAYDVCIRLSADGGRTWGSPVRPHTDGTASQHGFATLLAEDGAWRAVWLDGRETAGGAEHGRGPGGDGAMTLRTARIGADGVLDDEALLDPRTCDCCGTAAAVTGTGTLIAYRDRSAAEVRDIALVSGAGGHWSEPRPLHRDGWKIRGCPVNGPTLAAAGDAAAIAWFTGARDTDAVYVALSSSGAFGVPRRVDDGDPLGRTGLTLLEDGAAVVSWIEMAADTAEIRLRRVAVAGRTSTSRVLARTSPRRASGFPQIARDGERIVCAWTEPGSPSRVRVAAVPLE